MRVLDLFCGLGGFSQAFRDRGHDVLGIDNQAPADVIADVADLPLRGYHPDVILASPPCTEFFKAKLNWNDGKEPSMALVHATLETVAKLRPTYWVLENTQGLYTHWDRRPMLRWGSHYLWGEFPLFLSCEDTRPWRKSKGRTCVSGNPREAARIPYPLSKSLCLTMERASRSSSCATPTPGPTEPGYPPPLTT